MSWRNREIPRHSAIWRLFTIVGGGTDPDGKKAAELWEAVGALNIAQEHLSAVAYHNLSVLYIVGAPGLIPNSEKAAKYDRLAKESGFALEANSDSPTPE